MHTQSYIDKLRYICYTVNRITKNNGEVKYEKTVKIIWNDAFNCRTVVRFRSIYGGMQHTVPYPRMAFMAA